jgi:cell division protein FtsQ
MRFVKRGKTEPAPVRIRRRRPMQRRVLYAGAVLGVFAMTLAGATLLIRSGQLDAVLNEAQLHIADLGATLHLTVQSVEVEGRERADRQAILDALSVKRGSPILAVDLEAAKARLESVAWIRSAAIERMLPDTIHIRLVEDTPLAIWQHDGKFSVINQEGAVISNANAGQFPSLLQVVGEAAPHATPTLIEMMAGEEDLAHHVTAAVRVGDRRWNIEFDNGIQLILPEEGADAAWRRLATLDRSDRLLERAVTAIDMRLPDRLVLRVSPEISKSVIKKVRPTGPNT